MIARTRFFSGHTVFESIEISTATLCTPMNCLLNYLKTQFIRFYSNKCDIYNCFVYKKFKLKYYWWSYSIHTLPL